MEHLDQTAFNDVVIGALDEVYGALESDHFLAGDLAGTHEGLSCYLAQLNRISLAAEAAEMPGLHAACCMIESNVQVLQEEMRQLTSIEYGLLSEVPELLAQYSLNQSCCKIEGLLKHLLKPGWPVPLHAEDVAAMRQMLDADPGEANAAVMIKADVCEECEAAPVTTLNALEKSEVDPLAVVTPTNIPARSNLATDLVTELVTDGAPSGSAVIVGNDEGHDAGENFVDNPQHEARLALHDALDALIITIGENEAFAASDASDANDADALVRYASKLQELSACAAQAGVAALASACDVFARVVIQRASQSAMVTDAERGLLNLFPILTMDSIADPENPATGCALMELACDPLWDCIHAAANGSNLHGIAADNISLTEAPLCILQALPAPEPIPQEISQQMLALLARELGMLAEVLDADLAAVFVPDLSPAARSEAVQNYFEAVGRVGETSASVGLSALNGVICQLIDLLASLPQGLQPEHQSLLQQLPERISAYLVCPIDMQHCTPLLEWLLDAQWGCSLQDFPMQAWCEALTFVVLVEEEQEEVERQSVASAADVSLEIPVDINPALLQGLLQELPMQVESFTSAIARCAHGSGTLADVEQAQRAAHTLKGAANTVGVVGIAVLTHHLEDILLPLSEEMCMPDAALADLLSEAGDCLESMSEAVLGIGPAPEQALDVLQRVLDYANHGEVTPRTAQLAQQAVGAAVAAQPIARTSLPSVSANVSANTSIVQAEAVAVTNVEDSDAIQMLRVPAPVVDELLRLAGENVISNSQLQERLRLAQQHSKAAQKQDALFQKLIAELENLVDVRGLGNPRNAQHTSKHAGDFDPLEFERYSELHTITSQLIEASTDARQMAGHIDEQLHELGELLQVQRRLQIENQKAVIRTRLVPVSSVVSRLQRTVRQACRLLGKEVELIVLGENTNIDSNMLAELIDPLMHLLRNAVDHGIEDLAERQAKGKPAVGQIQLRFSSEGNSIIVRCADDGAGLDLVAIRRSAAKKNLLAEERVLNEDEVARLILIPGFSTRDTTTQLSGRGIGMDAVNSKILEMKGALSLHNKTGLGLTVELRMPATLLSEHTLMARINGKMLAISSRRILDITYIQPEQIDFLGNEAVYRVGDVLHKVRSLSDLLGMPSQPLPKQQSGFPALLTNTDSGETCVVLLQELIDGREAVVKKLGRYVPRIPGTIGAVILGDGSVAPVLDLVELLRASSPQYSLHQAQRQAYQELQHHVDQAAMPHVRSALIVDDSLSARRATAQVMRDAGFEVRTAIDGMDAVTMLEQSVPDVILVDMEMPRMNGLELTSHVRGRERTKHVPIIMITSRSTEKHRQLGATAGVNAYLLKPFNDDNLLDQVTQLLQQGA